MRTQFVALVLVVLVLEGTHDEVDPLLLGFGGPGLPRRGQVLLLQPLDLLRTEELQFELLVLLFEVEAAQELQHVLLVRLELVVLDEGDFGSCIARGVLELLR